MTAVDAYLPPGLLAEDLLAYAVGVLTFGSVVLVWRALLERQPQAARVRAVVRRRAELQAELAGSGRRRRRTQLPIGLIGAAVKRLQLLQTAQTEKIRNKLLRAGFRSREAMGAHAVVKLACPPLFALVAFLLFHVLRVGAIPLPFRPVALAAAVLLGFLGPDLYLANAAAKRRQALQKALQDGLDLLVICAEAGLSLDTALHRVAEEVAVSSPKSADELAVTSVELNFLPERRLALENLAKRVDLAAIRGVVNTLIQTERYGTPLSQSMRLLSAEFRDQRMLRAEEKAARLPATLTVPMILFILPTLFIVLIGPAMVDVYDNLSK
jgi:tight adherence protein C